MPRSQPSRAPTKKSNLLLASRFQRVRPKKSVRFAPEQKNSPVIDDDTGIEATILEREPISSSSNGQPKLILRVPNIGRSSTSSPESSDVSTIQSDTSTEDSNVLIAEQQSLRLMQPGPFKSTLPTLSSIKCLDNNDTLSNLLPTEPLVLTTQKALLLENSELVQKPRGDWCKRVLRDMPWPERSVAEETNFLFVEWDLPGETDDGDGFLGFLCRWAVHKISGKDTAWEDVMDFSKQVKERNGNRNKKEESNGQKRRRNATLIRKFNMEHGIREHFSQSPFSTSKSDQQGGNITIPTEQTGAHEHQHPASSSTPLRTETSYQWPKRAQLNIFEEPFEFWQPPTSLNIFLRFLDELSQIEEHGFVNLKLLVIEFRGYKDFEERLYNGDIGAYITIMKNATEFIKDTAKRMNSRGVKINADQVVIVGIPGAELLEVAIKVNG